MLKNKRRWKVNKLKIIISGGGTGGHIFPAIAIANAIKTKQKDTEFLFVGAEGKMEMEKVPEAGYKIVGLPIIGIQRSMSLKNLKLPFKLIVSFRKAKKIIKEFKPDVAVGVGGYASGPLLLAAQQAGIATLIQEQNSFAGLTNRMLGKRVNRICVAYDGMEVFFPKDKIVKTGNPVRSEMVDIIGKEERAKKHFQLNENKKTLLIVGGSLGAWAINEAIASSLDKLKEAQIQLIWQTGKLYYENAIKAAEGKGEWVKIHEFIKPMDLAYSTADLVVSRAGAIAVSELVLVKKPVIFVPLPSAAENHQTKNAQVLVRQKAAELIENKDAKEKLGDRIISLIRDEESLKKMSRQMGVMGLENAADKIANEVIKLATK